MRNNLLYSHAFILLRYAPPIFYFYVPFFSFPFIYHHYTLVAFFALCHCYCINQSAFILLYCHYQNLHSPFSFVLFISLIVSFFINYYIHTITRFILLLVKSFCFRFLLLFRILFCPFISPCLPLLTTTTTTIVTYLRSPTPARLHNRLHTNIPLINVITVVVACNN